MNENQVRGGRYRTTVHAAPIPTQYLPCKPKAAFIIEHVPEYIYWCASRFIPSSEKLERTGGIPQVPYDSSNHAYTRGNFQYRYLTPPGGSGVIDRAAGRPAPPPPSSINPFGALRVAPGEPSDCGDTLEPRSESSSLPSRTYAWKGRRFGSDERGVSCFAPDRLLLRLYLGLYDVDVLFGVIASTVEVVASGERATPVQRIVLDAISEDCAKLISTV